MHVMSLSVTKIEHHKIEPITKHLFQWQEKSIQLAKPNQNFGEYIRGYNNHAYKSSTKTQIIFIDRTYHKLTIHRIQTNTPQKVITRIDLQEHRGKHCIHYKKYTSVMIHVCHSRSRFLSCMYIHDDFMTESRQSYLCYRRSVP